MYQFNKFLAASAADFEGAALSNAPALTAGVVYVFKIPVPSPITITNVLAYVNTGGSTLTTAQNFSAVFNSAGTRLGLSADQTTPWATSGVKTMALTVDGGQSLTVGGAGQWVYAALLSNGTTPPVFAGPVSTIAAAAYNMGLVAADGFRCGSILTGQTTMPSSITIASVTAAVPRAFIAVT